MCQVYNVIIFKVTETDERLTFLTFLKDVHVKMENAL